MATQSQIIAKTILQQLGGLNTLVALVNAQNFVSHDGTKKDGTTGGVSFKISCRGAKANYIKIMLTSADLYNFEAGVIRNGQYKVTVSEDLVYNDMLIDLCEKATQLTFRMPRVVGFNTPAPAPKSEPTPAQPMATKPLDVCIVVPTKGSHNTPKKPATQATANRGEIKPAGMWAGVKSW